MSDNTAVDTQPKEETTAAASVEVEQAAAPVAEPESTTPEDPKPESDTAEPVAAAQDTEPEPSAESAAEPAAEPAAVEENKQSEDSEEKPAEESAAAAEQTEAATEEEKTTVSEEVTAEPEPEPEPIEIPSGNGELVLVTGATGYLASHIIKQLHESGEFKVRGTVRSLEDNSKLDALKALLHDGENPVEFVEADLLKPESWTDAVKDCEYVIHTASPFPMTDPTDENDVINPAKEGTLAVLKASVEAKTVKRVVITSSIAAIVSGKTLDKNACKEDMWADCEKSSSAYDKSKTIAEKSAWDFVKELPEDSPLELSVVNPGFIVGPPLMKMDGTSIEVIKKLMNREYSTLPKISFACSDVRDVALAHMRAMMIKQAAGNRHILVNSNITLQQLAKTLAAELNDKGFNIPTTQVPYVLVWFKSHFDPTIKRILPDVGKIYNFDTSRMRTVLQVEPRDVRASLIEMGHAMINLEIVQKVEKAEKKPRKLTFRKKKEKKVDEEQEEKKDEPEKAASTSGSADNGSVPDATIEDVEIKIESEPAAEQPAAETTEEDKPEAAAEEETAKPAEEQAASAEAMEAEVKTEDAAAEEVKTESADEDKAAADSAAVHSEEEVKKEEATTSDPESTKKKDKKAKKEKKEKGEKKKGGLFSFSFKKNKKPHVEKKAEGDKSDEDAALATEEAKADETTTDAATEEAPAETATEETAAASEQAPAQTEENKTEEAPAEAAATEEATTTTAEEAPATEDEPAKPAEEPVTADDTPAKSEEAPAEAATESTEPAKTEE